MTVRLPAAPAPWRLGLDLATGRAPPQGPAGGAWCAALPLTGSRTPPGAGPSPAPAPRGHCAAGRPARQGAGRHRGRATAVPAGPAARRRRPARRPARHGLLSLSARHPHAGVGPRRTSRSAAVPRRHGPTGRARRAPRHGRRRKPRNPWKPAMCWCSIPADRAAARHERCRRPVPDPGHTSRDGPDRAGSAADPQRGVRRPRARGRRVLLLVARVTSQGVRGRGAAGPARCATGGTGPWSPGHAPTGGLRRGPRRLRRCPSRRHR